MSAQSKNTQHHSNLNAVFPLSIEPASSITSPSEEKRVQVPEKIKALRSAHNYSTIYGFLLSKGKELYGPAFAFLETDTAILIKLMVWFARDEINASSLGLSLQKGIMLNGPVGCGKTSLMNIFRFLLPAEQRHYIRPCRDIAQEFSNEGHNAMLRYTKNSFSQFSGNPRTYCFDDLGLEPTVQHYGNTVTVMAEIMLSRYDFFHAFQMLTHITTNLNSDEIEKIYGLRVRSRMRELFNLIAFDQHAPDKRK